MVTCEDSWKEKSMFTSVMLWCGITGTFPLLPEIYKEPDRDSRAEEGGSGTSIQGHRIEGSIHTLSQFTVLGGWLCSLSLCLSGYFFLSLSFSPPASHSARGEAEISWCLHKHNDPQVLCVLEPAKKDKICEKRLMERTERVVWRIVKKHSR